MISSSSRSETFSAWPQSWLICEDFFPVRRWHWYHLAAYRKPSTHCQVNEQTSCPAKTTAASGSFNHGHPRASSFSIIKIRWDYFCFRGCLSVFFRKSDMASSRRSFIGRSRSMARCLNSLSNSLFTCVVNIFFSMLILIKQMNQ